MSGNMERVLRLMSEKGASDVYLSANTPILIKISGQIMQLSDQPLKHTQPRQLLSELLTPRQLEDLDETGELNVGIGISQVGSYRLSAFRQRGTIAAVIRELQRKGSAQEAARAREKLVALAQEAEERATAESARVPREPRVSDDSADARCRRRGSRCPWRRRGTRRHRAR